LRRQPKTIRHVLGVTRSVAEEMRTKEDEKRKYEADLSFACLCFISCDPAVWYQGLPQRLDESPSARVPQNGEGYGSWQRFIVGANPQPFELGALYERGELRNSSRNE
jgi:hypothetical protein